MLPIADEACPDGWPWCPMTSASSPTCLTGIRAEMACHKLEEAGYEAGFLNAEIDIAMDGSFKITPR